MIFAHIFWVACLIVWQVCIFMIIKNPGEHLDLMFSIMAVAAIGGFMISEDGQKNNGRNWVASLWALFFCQLVLLVYMLILPGFMTIVGFWYVMLVILGCGAGLWYCDRGIARVKPTKPVAVHLEPEV